MCGQFCLWCLGVVQRSPPTINGVEVLLRLIVQLPGLLLELLKASLGIGIDGILGLFADVELDLELLRRSDDTLLEALETHLDRWLWGGVCVCMCVKQREEEEVAKAGG